MINSEISQQSERFDYLMVEVFDLPFIGNQFLEKSKVTSASAYNYIYDILKNNDVQPSMIHPEQKEYYSSILIREARSSYRDHLKQKK